MKIMLTGACGLIGRAIRRLAGDQHEMVLVDTAEQVTKLGGYQADVTDAQAMLEISAGCQAIIHTAAMHGSSFGKQPNDQFIRVNVGGAENLFQAALHHGIRRLVFSSTMEVLIGHTWDAYGTAVLDETFPPRPNWIYPVTKLMVEHLSTFYAQHHDLEVVNLRYMGVDEDVGQHGWDLLARYVHVDDVARANLLATTTPGLRNEVLNIGPDTPLTQDDVNQAATDSAAVVEKYFPGSTRVMQDHGIVLERQMFVPVTRIDQARRTLGWQPRHTFRDYLSSLGWQAP